MDGFEENLARAIADYLKLPEVERLRCERTVRQNSVYHLSWATLGKDLVALLQT